ncbi:MAG: hypothetical protein ACRBG0_19230 [Lewinella sp.]|uniref:hypothetical protein n=1 Tax=Lewinella sp. TaxID=2004506 RepID=UPI003D6AD91E
MNYYRTSTGYKLTQQTLDRNVREAYRIADQDMPRYICECCGKVPPVDHDHTISVKRCKELDKAELAWDPRNWSYSCRTCHNVWENFKSGMWSYAKNAARRLRFVLAHDKETFAKRFQSIKNDELREDFKKYYDEL